MFNSSPSPAIADGRDNRVARLAAGDHLQPAVDGRVPHNRRRHADHQGKALRWPKVRVAFYYIDDLLKMAAVGGG